MKRFSFFFSLIFFIGINSLQALPITTPTELKSKEILGNRVILQVNNFYYTQRDLETHYLIKIAIKDLLTDKEEFSLINEKNWEKQLDQFKNDMIVFIESQRLGKFQPTEEKIKKIREAVDKHLATNSDFKRLKEHLDISSELIEKSIIIILQVDDFKISRRSITDRVSYYRAERWFQELEKRYVIRFFYGTSDYQPI